MATSAGRSPARTACRCGRPTTGRTTKSIWEAGATSPIETGTQRFEQLVCDPNTLTGPVLFVKWFNQNGFGAIPVDTC